MKCKDCGEETENSCTSIIDGHTWYKCSKCFEKEQNNGCMSVIFGTVGAAILYAIVIYFS
jgi:hypothetical protein